MLILKNNNYNGSRIFSDYPFELSDFQKHSIESIDSLNNVLVCAPTSSGKTLVAEYMIRKNKKNGNRKKVIYTTPIKALSNYIFNELTLKGYKISSVLICYY